MAKLLHIIQCMPETPLFNVFYIFIIGDIVTGYAKAFITKKPSSKVGMNGLIKHTLIFAGAVVMFSVFEYLGLSMFAQAILMFGVGNYGISILENYVAIGIKVPPFLEQFFEGYVKQSEAQAEEKKEGK